MVSMKDIAKACGVSVATVSKVLNGYSDIGSETRKRVQQTAEEMGYYPNSSARALKTKKTFNLGVLFVDEAHSGLTHDFFAHILESVKSTAERHGYDITFTSSNIAGRKTTYAEHCRYRGVDGVLIACVDFYEPGVQELIRGNLPVVTIDHIFDNRIAVCSDNTQGMKDLTEYVIAKGHRKIAYIHGIDSSVTAARLASFYRVMAQHEIEIPDEYVMEAPYRNVSDTARCTRTLMSLKNPPTCILYPDDISCIGGYNQLQRMGYTVGKDISIAGYDGIPISGYVRPKMTTIWQDTETIGRYATERLISLIEEPKTTLIDRVIVPGRLIEGGSVVDLNKN